MNSTIAAELLADEDLGRREAEALQAWIQANAAAVAARAWHDAAVRTNRGTRTTARNLQAALAAEHAARDLHRSLSDELARRRLAPARTPSAA